MADMQFGLMMRAQFPSTDDMQMRFQELMAQARLVNQLGYSCITNGMHYSSAPFQDFQQMPFLCRMMAEAPDLRINFGLILLSLHKPLDVAEQLATADVLSGGKVIFGLALGYREVEFLAFGTSQRQRVKRLEENLEASHYECAMAGHAANDGARRAADVGRGRFSQGAAGLEENEAIK